MYLCLSLWIERPWKPAYRCSVLSPLDKYLLVRDVTFFVADFYTGDRASDLGRLKADQIFRLWDREGFLLNFTFSKTRRAGQLRPLALLRIPNVPVCPVFWLNYVTWGVRCSSSW